MNIKEEMAIGGPGVADGTKDVDGPLGVCPCKPRIF